MTTDGFVISQPKGQRTLALRESYLAICNNDTCEAHLLNAVERWYAYKLKIREESRGRNRAARRSGEPETADEALWVRMSAGQWVTDLLGQYTEKTLRLKLARLVERGFLMTRAHPTLKWDRTPQWLFMRSAVQAAVDAWGGKRAEPDLDPGPSDGLGNTNLDHSVNLPSAIGNRDQDEAVKLPNQEGKITELSRSNDRSNNTGFLPQKSSTGGVLDVVGDARVAELLTPPAPVVEVSPAQFTTTDAALQKDVKAVREPSASVAVLDAPTVDASGESLISDADLEHLFGSKSQASAEPGTVTEVQEVPGGGAGVAALDGLLAASEVPHSPEDTRVALQRALGGPRRLADLLEETPPGLRDGTRHRWVSTIAPERVEELARQGREQKTMHPWTAITQLLDQEIGAKIQRGTGQGGLSYSGSHAPARRAEAPDYSQDQGKYEPGARWAEKATGTVRVLAGLETGENKVAGAGARYKFEDGLAVPALTLMTKYEFQQARE